MLVVIDVAVGVLDIYPNGDWSTFHRYLIRREQEQLYPNRSQLIKSLQSPTREAERGLQPNH